MGFSTYVILITSALLIVDTLFSLFHFRYTFLVEIKRRFANYEKIPFEYKNKLIYELNDDVGLLRRLVQSSYVFWFFITIFSKLWILPVVLSLAIFLTNLFYKNAYISPIVLLLNLILSLTIYMFVIVNIYLKII